MCVFLRSHTSSRTCTQPHANRSGSGPTGKEVGGGIDKAVNEVIGRINGDPKGTMSISACRSLSLSVCLSAWGSRRVGCYGRQRQSVTQREWVHKQNVIHNRAGHGLCCCSLPHPSIWQDNGTAWHNTEHWLPLWGQSKDWDTIHELELIIHRLRPIFFLTAFVDFILTMFLFCLYRSSAFMFVYFVTSCVWIDKSFSSCMSTQIQNLQRQPQISPQS